MCSDVPSSKTQLLLYLKGIKAIHTKGQCADKCVIHISKDNHKQGMILTIGFE